MDLDVCLMEDERIVLTSDNTCYQNELEKWKKHQIVLFWRLSSCRVFYTICGIEMAKEFSNAITVYRIQWEDDGEQLYQCQI